MKHFLLIGLIGVTLAAQPATAPQEQTPDPEKERQELRAQAENEARFLPIVQAKSYAEIAVFRLADNDLQLRTALPSSRDRRKVIVENMPGFSAVVASASAATETPYVPEYFNFTHQDFSDPDIVVTVTQILASPGRLQIARGVDCASSMLNVDFIQDESFLAEGDEKVRLYVKHVDDQSGDDKVDVSLMATNIIDLRQRYPTEVRTYLDPIFRDLGQPGVLMEVDPRTAWQALSFMYEPDAALKEKIVRLIAALDADDPKKRDSAVQEIEKLGQPAALVLMHLDRAGLSFEQNNRIDTFLAAYKPVRDEEAKRMSRDPEFLLLALTADEPLLRGFALKQLEKVTGREIKFDLNATAEQQIDAISALRADIAPSTRKAGE